MTRQVTMSLEDAQAATRYLGKCLILPKLDGVDNPLTHLAEVIAQRVADAVRAERVRCYTLVKQHIRFDDYQQHLHSWHTLQDLLDAISQGDRRGVDTESRTHEPT